MKMATEFMYKGVQIKIYRSFGYDYHFTFYNRLYEGFYDSMENSKNAAKSEIDRLTMGRDLSIPDIGV